MAFVIFFVWHGKYLLIMEIHDEIEAITATFPSAHVHQVDNHGELQLSMTAITIKFIWPNYPLPVPTVHVSAIDATRGITTHDTAHVIHALQQEMQPAAEAGGGALLAGLFLAQELDAELNRTHEIGSASAAAPIPSPVSVAAAAAAPAPPGLESEPAASCSSDACRPHVHITSGPKFTVKKSVFQAHVAQVHSSAEVQAVMYQLCQDKHIAKATHNMRAWRFTDAREVLVMDNDDDGEDAAGGRLAMLLDLMKVDGAMVVVSRWYGGVKLGPARFKHINNVARELLEAEGLSRR